VTVILILLVSIAILVLGGHVYSKFLARSWGEQPDRITPAVRLNDGHDYVPTPTPVVFAHHFASIAGAGPIIGPVIAVCYGWLPAVLWVVFGGMLIGAVHDYLATFMSTRMSGQSMATVVRRLLGTGPFVALVIFLVLLLALVCATFLNLSAAALVSLVPCNRLDLDSTQTIFRTVNEQVIIGGIASTSVIVITALAPFVGWLYIKKRVAVWKCSVLALIICAISIVFGLYVPVSVATSTWKVILAIYVLLAAGLPVWLFLQSRDFINVHILYIGLSLLATTVVVAACRGASVPAADALPALDLASGSRAMGFIWPGLFITVACGAVSGFHSLCAGGTTCKQLVSEPAARRIGYWGMVLESVLAITVICVLLLGLRRADYLADVHPALVGLKTGGNPILSFAMSVGFASHSAFGLPIAVGALGGMILLEGFLVTTLDTAVRLMRYLLEEVWRALFGLAAIEAEQLDPELEPAGADGLLPGAAPAALQTPSILARVLSHYWVNSGIAVALMLWFSFSSGIMTLWGLFATANQLLAAFVLGLGALWLLRSGRRVWYIVGPALFMLVTTGASLFLLLRKFLPGTGATGAPVGNTTLFGASLVLCGLTLYLLLIGIREAISPRSCTTHPGRRGGRNPPTSGRR
jgi:carbon starvation protein